MYKYREVIRDKIVTHEALLKLREVVRKTSIGLSHQENIDIIDYRLIGKEINESNIDDMIPISISAVFDDSSSYDSNNSEALKISKFDTSTLKSIRISYGNFSSVWVMIEMNPFEISITVQSPREDWVKLTINDISEQIRSWHSQNYSGSFLYRYYGIRSLLEGGIIAALLYMVNMLATKQFGAGSIPQIVIVIATSLAVLVASLWNTFKTPSFRTMWPIIEFDIGPEDNKPGILRAKYSYLPKVYWGAITLAFIPYLVNLL